MHAALSIWKRPTKVPNWKSVPYFFLFAQACERIFMKMHRIKSRYVIGPWNIPFAGVYVYIFKSRYVIGPWNIPFAGVYVYIFKSRYVIGPWNIPFAGVYVYIFKSRYVIGPWNIPFAGVYVYIFKSRYVIGPWNIPFAGVYVYIFKSRYVIGPWNIPFAGVYVYIFKSRYVIGPWNIPFAGVYVYIFQLRNFTGLGSEGVKYFVSKFWFSQFRFSWYTAPLFFLNDHHSQSLHHLPDQVLAVHVQAYLDCTRLITFSDLLRNTCTAFGSTCLTPLLPSNKFCHWE